MKVPTVPLGSICHFVGGGTPSRKRPDFFMGDIPWVTVKDFKGLRLFDAEEHISETAVRESATNVVEPGTILLVTRVGLGKVAIAERPLAINQDIKGLTPAPDVLPDFLLWFLLSKAPDIERMGTGATVKGVTLHDIKSLRMPVPLLDQQRRIVDLLSRAEGIVRLRREAQVKAAEITQALFLDMFGRLPPEKYARCADVCHFITKGTTPQSGKIMTDPSDETVPFIKVLHITDDGDLNFSKQPSFVSEELHRGLLARSAVYPQDVLMNIVGPPLGRICLVPGTFPQWNVNQALAIFRVRDEILPHFLFSALRSPLVLPGILRLPVGVRQLNISLEQCRNIRVPLPTIKEQRDFVDRFFSVQSIKSSQALATARAEATFQSLLTRAFGSEQATASLLAEEAAVA